MFFFSSFAPPLYIPYASFCETHLSLKSPRIPYRRKEKSNKKALPSPPDGQEMQALERAYRLPLLTAPALGDLLEAHSYLGTERAPLRQRLFTWQLQEVSPQEVVVPPPLCFTCPLLPPQSFPAEPWYAHLPLVALLGLANALLQALRALGPTDLEEAPVDDASLAFVPRTNAVALAARTRRSLARIDLKRILEQHKALEQRWFAKNATTLTAWEAADVAATCCAQETWAHSLYLSAEGWGVLYARLVGQAPAPDTVDYGQLSPPAESLLGTHAPLLAQALLWSTTQPHRAASHWALAEKVREQLQRFAALGGPTVAWDPDQVDVALALDHEAGLVVLADLLRALRQPTTDVGAKLREAIQELPHVALAWATLKPGVLCPPWTRSHCYLHVLKVLLSRGQDLEPKDIDLGEKLCAAVDAWQHAVGSALWEARLARGTLVLLAKVPVDTTPAELARAYRRAGRVLAPRDDSAETWLAQTLVADLHVAALRAVLVARLCAAPSRRSLARARRRWPWSEAPAARPIKSDEALRARLLWAPRHPICQSLRALCPELRRPPCETFCCAVWWGGTEQQVTFWSYPENELKQALQDEVFVAVAQCAPILWLRCLLHLRRVDAARAWFLSQRDPQTLQLGLVLYLSQMNWRPLEPGLPRTTGSTRPA